VHAGKVQRAVSVPEHLKALPFFWEDQRESLTRRPLHLYITITVLGRLELTCRNDDMWVPNALGV